MLEKDVVDRSGGAERRGKRKKMQKKERTKREKGTVSPSIEMAEVKVDVEVEVVDNAGGRGIRGMGGGARDKRAQRRSDQQRSHRD